MRVLVTGAFGALGVPVMAEALRQGHEVRCLDVPARRNRRAAAPFTGRIDTIWGDVRDRDVVARAVAARDAVIHLAGVLPPVTEREPERARSVNVDGTRVLLEALAAAPARIVFASSVSVFGPDQEREPPRRAHEPALPTDEYTRHKAACEAMVMASAVPWLVFRVGVAVDPAAPSGSPDALRTLFEVSPENRLEWVHPRDVARAAVNALACDEAWGKVLLIGGGPRCQVRQRDLFAAFLAALGVPMLPDAAFGRRPFYTDWMDTAESQALLSYQTATFADFRRDLAWHLRHRRRLLRPLRPLVRRALLRYSGPWARRHDPVPSGRAPWALPPSRR